MQQSTHKKTFFYDFIFSNRKKLLTLLADIVLVAYVVKSNHLL